RRAPGDPRQPARKEHDLEHGMRKRHACGGRRGVATPEQTQTKTERRVPQQHMAEDCSNECHGDTSVQIGPGKETWQPCRLSKKRRLRKTGADLAHWSV